MHYQQRNPTKAIVTLRAVIVELCYRSPNFKSILIFLHVDGFKKFTSRAPSLSRTS